MLLKFLLHTPLWILACLACNWGRSFITVWPFLMITDWYDYWEMNGKTWFIKCLTLHYQVDLWGTPINTPGPLDHRKLTREWMAWFIWKEIGFIFLGDSISGTMDRDPKWLNNKSYLNTNNFYDNVFLLFEVHKFEEL